MLKFFRSFFHNVQFVLALVVVLLPAPWIGGLDTTAYFVLRSLVLAAFLILLIRWGFFGTFTFKKEWQTLQGPLALFFLFPLFVFLQAFGGTAAVSTKIFPGSIESFSTREHAFQVLVYTMLFFVFLDSFSSPKKIRWILILLAVEIVFLVSLGFYQVRSGPGPFRLIYGFYPVQNYMSFFSSFTNANHYGCFLTVSSFLFLASVATWLRKGNFFKGLSPSSIECVFFSLMLVLITFSIFYADARACLFIQLFQGLLLWTLAVDKVNKKSLLVVCLSLSAVFVLLLLTSQSVLTYSKALYASFLNRLQINVESLRIFFDFPFFGTGLGTYKWIAKVYQEVESENYWLTHAHNDFLELLTDTGIVGFLLFIVPILWLILMAFRNLSQNPSERSRIYGVASLSSLVALAFLSLSEFYLRTPAIAVLFLLNFALFVKHSFFYAEEALPQGKSILLPAKLNGAVRVPLIFLLILLVAVAGYHSYRCFQSQKILDNTTRYKFLLLDSDLDRERLKRSSRDDKAILKAIELCPDNFAAWLVLADSLLDEAMEDAAHFREFVSRSIQAYEVSTRLAPTWSDGWFYQGYARIVAGEVQQGLLDMEKAVELSAYNRDSYLSVILNYLKASEKALVPENKRRYRKKAFEWFRKSGFLKRPITSADYDFIGLGSAKLDKKDASLIGAFLAQT